MKMDITAYTWIILVFGAITFLPLFVAQFIMIINPNGRLPRDLIIGKGENWRDKTHFKSALAFAWADILVILPLLIFSFIGIFNNHSWGYILQLIAGGISIYFSIIFWVFEKEYTYAAQGWFAYFTYFWGFFLYWGIGASVYSFSVLI